ncbi:MAG: NAD-dependent epimerase/dehydratase family protein [Candidatus Thorarchaeota archaeon]
MKVLLTGAFGNVGESALEILINRNYEVTCLDKSSLATRKVARRFRKKVSKIYWTDIRNKKIVEKAVQDQDLVLHVAAIIPPKANKNKKYTTQVNTDGTKNIVDAIKKQPNPPKLIYTSSVAIYGDVRTLESPTIKIDYGPNPSPGDHYAVTKLKAEEYIRNSDLNYIIFRLSYIPNSKKIALTPLMFRMPLDTPIEFTHTEDTGLALVNAIEVDELWGNIYNLGGGKKCQFVYKEYLRKMLPLMGVEMLPDTAFSNDPFHCCYYETEELNDLLHFQNHDLDDLLNEMIKNARSKRVMAKMFKPLVKPTLLMLSPYYKQNKKNSKK